MDPESRRDGKSIPNNNRFTEGQFETTLCIICSFDYTEIVLFVMFVAGYHNST